MTIPRLIETVRVRGGEVPLWPLHLERLTRSAAALDIPVPPLHAPTGGDDRAVRFEVSHEGVVITEREIGDSGPIALVSWPDPHRGYAHKVADRGWLEAARLAVRPQAADDALFFDAEGRLVESSIWTIGWWDEETLVFPPLALGGLPGVARARLAETVRGGIGEGVLTRDQLAWRSLVACNAVRGLVPVAVLDGEAVPGNLRTAEVAKRFWNRRTA
jgi:branched-subunit amino acid aminotransferase/4-amino-4-deoxychorismate lyase